MKCLTTALADIPWVRHGFFTRQGGISSGIYRGLNCGPGSKDDPAHVQDNRLKVAQFLGVADDRLLTPRQIHSFDAAYVSAAVPYDSMPKVDALVTDIPGLAVGVLTADCAPVLLACRKKRIVAAVHAGWRGAVGGVLESAVAEMQARGAAARDIVAAVGPCIGPQSYEVSDGFEKPFIEHDKANEKFFHAAGKPGHLLFDLPGYVASRLRRAGVEEVFDTKQDTLTAEDAYYSYRRSCLRSDPDYGRQISAISICFDGE